MRREGPGGPDDVVVLVDGGPASDAYDDLLVRAVRTALRSEGSGEAEISVALLGDEGMRRLNREHLGHDRPTDVIAFELWESGEPIVGDVYVGFDQAARQAAEEGVPLHEELVRLAVHGTLHVLGWEHPEGEVERRASAMWRRQEELVRFVMGHGG